MQVTVWKAQVYKYKSLLEGHVYVIKNFKVSPISGEYRLVDTSIKTYISRVTIVRSIFGSNGRIQKKKYSSL